MAKKYRRRRYFIRKRQQGKFILWFVAASALGGFVAVVLFNILAQRKLDAVLYGMRLPTSSTSGVLIRETLYANGLAVLFIIVAFLLTARGLFVKIHGPLRKIAAELHRIGKGDLRREVGLRRRDEFQDFATDVNGMVAALRDRFARIRKSAELMASLCDTVGEARDLATLRKEVGRHIADLEQEIKAFKT